MHFYILHMLLLHICKCCCIHEPYMNLALYKQLLTFHGLPKEIIGPGQKVFLTSSFMLRRYILPQIILFNVLTEGHYKQYSFLCFLVCKLAGEMLTCLISLTIIQGTFFWKTITSLRGNDHQSCLHENIFW